MLSLTGSEKGPQEGTGSQTEPMLWHTPRGGIKAGLGITTAAGTLVRVEWGRDEMDGGLAFPGDHSPHPKPVSPALHKPVSHCHTSHWTPHVTPRDAAEGGEREQAP